MQLRMVQLESEHMRPAANLERIEHFVKSEAADGADFIVFPELATTGYLEPVTPDDSYDQTVTGHPTREEFLTAYATLAEEIPGPTTDRLTKVAEANDVHVAVGMLELVPGVPGVIANTVVAVGPNGVVGKQRKIHMPWNEKHVFAPGSELNVIQIAGVAVGINVCYDAYFPEQSRLLTLKGAELLLSCFTGPTRALDDRRVPRDRASFLARARAMENSSYFAALNRVGQQGGYSFIGNSAIAGPTGDLLASTESTDECTVSAEIERSEVVRARMGLSTLRDRRPELYKQLLEPWA